MQCVCVCVHMHKSNQPRRRLILFTPTLSKASITFPLNFIIYKDSRLLEIEVLSQHGELKYCHIIYSKLDCFNI